MGNRLSKLYTRTGDDGTSGLSGGERIAKNHERMNAMGTVDELNSVIGLMICKLEDAELKTFFTSIQHDLFNIGGSEAASVCHMARSIARRAERDVISLHQAEPVCDTTRQYLNRLSDLLFVTARIINLRQNHHRHCVRRLNWRHIPGTRKVGIDIR